MTEAELKVLYPMGLKISLCTGPLMIILILIEWFFIDKSYVIPTTFTYLVVICVMWVIMLIIGARK